MVVNEIQTLLKFVYFFAVQFKAYLVIPCPFSYEAPELEVILPRTQLRGRTKPLSLVIEAVKDARLETTPKSERFQMLFPEENP